MTTDAERLAALEEELYEAQEELEALRASLWLLMNSDDMERTRRVLLSTGSLATVGKPEPTSPPSLRVVDGGRSTERRRAAPRDRHGLHAV